MCIPHLAFSVRRDCRHWPHARTVCTVVAQAASSSGAVMQPLAPIVACDVASPRPSLPRTLPVQPLLRPLFGVGHVRRRSSVASLVASLLCQPDGARHLRHGSWTEPGIEPRSLGSKTIANDLRNRIRSSRVRTQVAQIGIGDTETITRLPSRSFGTAGVLTDRANKRELCS